MLRTVRHLRAARRLFLRIPVIMSLMVPLMACEAFQALDWGNRGQPAPVVVEPPMPEIVAPEPEKPLPPLPSRKPSAPQPPAQQGGAPNGQNGAAHDQAAEPPPVVGMNRSALIEQFGMPVAEREAAPARVIEFGSDECRLSAYLYFDTARNDFYVLQYQVNGIPERNDAADQCLKRIRDAARR